MRHHVSGCYNDQVTVSLIRAHHSKKNCFCRHVAVVRMCRSDIATSIIDATNIFDSDATFTVSQQTLESFQLASCSGMTYGSTITPHHCSVGYVGSAKAGD
jgi:hypothetical protein